MMDVTSGLGRSQPTPSSRGTRALVGIVGASVLALGASACGSSGGENDDAAPASAPSTTALAQQDFAGLVDIGGGRQIWATCKGQGSPTVVLISGHGNGAEDWSLILDPDDPVHDTPGDDLSAGMGTLVASDDAVFLATGERPVKRSLLEQLRHNRRVARTNRMKIRDGVPEDPTQRAAFLAAKQLVYLERYWKLYLPDEPLLGDHDFVRAVLGRD